MNSNSNKKPIKIDKALIDHLKQLAEYQAIVDSNFGPKKKAPVKRVIVKKKVCKTCGFKKTPETATHCHLCNAEL